VTAHVVSLQLEEARLKRRHQRAADHAGKQDQGAVRSCVLHRQSANRLGAATPGTIQLVLLSNQNDLTAAERNLGSRSAICPTKDGAKTWPHGRVEC
jgi:hypothetical protein